MPANLTPQYHNAETKYRQATTPQKKLETLQNMLREIPKHKGTEKIQADIKRKISQQKKLIAERSSKKVKTNYFVDNQGYKQVVFVGPPNSGRSSLISSLTGTKLKIAEYPYTTRVPHPAIMDFEDIKIQVVDTPAVSKTFFEPCLGNIIRPADLIVWLIDLTDDDIQENIIAMEKNLERQKLLLCPVENLPNEYNRNIIKPSLIIGNRKKQDPENTYEEFVYELHNRFKMYMISFLCEKEIIKIKEEIFKSLNIIRVYSKPPGKRADLSSPIILDKGSTIVDMANSIHKDLAKNLKSARIWNSAKHSKGQNIHRDCILHDGNIIELTE